MQTPTARRANQARAVGPIGSARNRCLERGASQTVWMGGGVERVMGIEPTLSAWEADVLPLNYTRDGERILAIRRAGGQAAMRSAQTARLTRWLAGARVLANNATRFAGVLPWASQDQAPGTRCGMPGTNGPRSSRRSDPIHGARPAQRARCRRRSD